jgi:carboxymethylenebutenolidase
MPLINQNEQKAGKYMGTQIKITAEDGHQFDAYMAESNGTAHGAMIVIQEVFGVNSHIRSVADDYSKQGYHSIAPALFDRVQPNVELSYNAEEGKRGMGMATQIGMDNMMKDVAASIKQARQQWSSLKVGVVGFCLGGSLAWLAATRLKPDAAVGYYGGRIAQSANETPRCPVMLHFGAKDAHISTKDIDTIRQAHPEIPIFLYDAGHGFNCDQRKDYEPHSANLARQRTLEFFEKNL